MNEYIFLLFFNNTQRICNADSLDEAYEKMHEAGYSRTEYMLLYMITAR